MPMNSDQYNYLKCGACMAANDFSKKDVYLMNVEGEVICRCAGHGGSGKPFVRPNSSSNVDEPQQAPVKAAVKGAVKKKG